MINLSQLKAIKREATVYKNLALNNCFNTPVNEHPADDAILLVMLKTHAQAKNLYTRLKRLCQVCTDFSRGDFQSYIHDYTECLTGLDTQPYDPFAELEACFVIGQGAADDLPTYIEQYAELFGLGRVLLEARLHKQAVLNRFTDQLPPQHYQAINPLGQLVQVSARELPGGMEARLDADGASATAEVDYVLDHYNQFYQQATTLIQTHKGGDASVCAAQLLSLFELTN